MKLNYKKYGEGHPFIILHGLYGSSDNWVNIGKALSTHFKVYLLDLRNHGNSPHHPDHSYSAMVTDLLEFIKDKSIEKATILGHSMGGKVVMQFATQYSHLISNLIVADIAPKSYINLNPDSKDFIDHRLILNALANIDFSKIVNRSQLDTLLMDYIKPEKIRQFMLKNIRKRRNLSNIESLGIFEWGINISALQNFLPEILDGASTFFNTKKLTSVPVLFIKGGHSEYIKAEDFALIKSIFPDAVIKTIPGTSHWLHAEEPVLFIKEIINFIF